MISNTSSCASLPSVYLGWLSVCLNYFPIFLLGYLWFHNWVTRAFKVFGICSLSYMFSVSVWFAFLMCLAYFTCLSFSKLCCKRQRFLLWGSIYQCFLSYFVLLSVLFKETSSLDRTLFILTLCPSYFSGISLTYLWIFILYLFLDDKNTEYQNICKHVLVHEN